MRSGDVPSRARDARGRRRPEARFRLFVHSFWRIKIPRRASSVSLGCLLRPPVTRAISPFAESEKSFRGSEDKTPARGAASSLSRDSNDVTRVPAPDEPTVSRHDLLLLHLLRPEASCAFASRRAPRRARARCSATVPGTLARGRGGARGAGLTRVDLCAQARRGGRDGAPRPRRARGRPRLAAPTGGLSHAPTG